MFRKNELYKQQANYSEVYRERSGPKRLLAEGISSLEFKYFIYDFNMASVYLVLGLPLFFWGFGFGLFHWFDSAFSGNPKTAGTIMVAALPLIISIEMLLQAVNTDIQNIPRKTKG